MSQNPPSTDAYYSPQSIKGEQFRLDLQVENIKTMIRLQQEHMNQIDAMLMDLQAQIRACEAKHG